MRYLTPFVKFWGQQHQTETKYEYYYLHKSKQISEEQRHTKVFICNITLAYCNASPEGPNICWMLLAWFTDWSPCFFKKAALISSCKKCMKSTSFSTIYNITTINGATSTNYERITPVFLAHACSFFLRQNTVREIPTVRAHACSWPNKEFFYSFWNKKNKTLYLESLDRWINFRISLNLI